jgi:hypothetical protein
MFFEQWYISISERSLTADEERRGRVSLILVSDNVPRNLRENVQMERK